MLLAVLLRTFAPITVQLPNIDIPCLAAVSLIAIVVGLLPGLKKLTPHCWALTAVMAFLTFWLLPWGRRARGGRRCGPARRRDRAGRCSLCWRSCSPPSGSACFSGKSNILAPLCVAVVMYLACQCFAGMLL